MRGETPRYSICTRELRQSNLALGLGKLVPNVGESGESKMLPVHLNQTSKEMLRKRTGWTGERGGGPHTKGPGTSSPTLRGGRQFC